MSSDAKHIVETTEFLAVDNSTIRSRLMTINQSLHKGGLNPMLDKITTRKKSFPYRHHDDVLTAVNDYTTRLAENRHWCLLFAKFLSWLG